MLDYHLISFFIDKFFLFIFWLRKKNFGVLNFLFDSSWPYQELNAKDTQSNELGSSRILKSNLEIFIKNKMAS